ncbi:MAG: universal stress protein [Chloroflexi bacterium]|nr:universal stress protein [Chloroflexota bacterium]
MYSCILVPLDGSKLAEKALAHAEGLAKSSGASVHLLMSMSRHYGGETPIGGGLESDQSVARTAELGRQLEEAEIQAAQQYLDHTATNLKNLGLETIVELTTGPAHEHVIDYAKQHGVDLIVMSTHGHGGLKRMLLGSTTDRVIRSGEVPVLVVP